MLMLSSYIMGNIIYGLSSHFFIFLSFGLIRIYVRFNFFEVHYYLFSACVLLSLIDTVSSVSIKERENFEIFFYDKIS
jgi:hypothetical protein